jgi:hypothetical protein
MFKVYCHMSCLIQCYITINPKTLLLIKKKSYTVKPRAREQHEYTFDKAKVYSSFSPLLP